MWPPAPPVPLLVWRQPRPPKQWRAFSPPPLPHRRIGASPRQFPTPRRDVSKMFYPFFLESDSPPSVGHSLPPPHPSGIGTGPWGSPQSMILDQQVVATAHLSGGSILGTSRGVPTPAPGPGNECPQPCWCREEIRK